MTDFGSGTCSNISIHVITSTFLLLLSENSSMVDCVYLIVRFDSAMCSLAILSNAGAISIPVTCAPLNAMASDKIPAPQPTSSISFSATLIQESIQFDLNGLILWRDLKSPFLSHQREA